MGRSNKMSKPIISKKIDAEIVRRIIAGEKASEIAQYFSKKLGIGFDTIMKKISLIKKGNRAELEKAGKKVVKQLFLSVGEKKKESRKYKNELIKKAEKFWKGKENIPEKDSLNWLLEPEFGAERASALIRARLILNENPLVANLLGITLKVGVEK